MEKQHNRGQDGAGVANIKLDMAPGERYISRLRSNAKSPIQDIFDQIGNRIKLLEDQNPSCLDDINYLKKTLDLLGNFFLAI